MENNILRITDVKKRYTLGEIYVNALNGVSLDINRGELISIVGPSGSGKSTLLNVIGLLSEPTEGKILLKGKDISKLSEDERAYIRGKTLGFVFQTFNLIPTFTSIENVSVPLMFYGYSKEKRTKIAQDLLTKVGLGHRLNSKPSQLSGGERQRVAIARALANEPEIILADEPTGNLDSKSGTAILDLFLKLNKEGKTIILVTHDPKLPNLTQRTIYIKDGVIEKEVKKK
ncbi:ABC transporter ATP-binding protein [Candidatus Micrarchaeota archaeon]|nr:ABC transporter ATP-binding protein [Candidatus Micrarchaeota archaeon]